MGPVSGSGLGFGIAALAIHIIMTSVNRGNSVPGIQSTFPWSENALPRSDMGIFCSRSGVPLTDSEW